MGLIRPLIESKKDLVLSPVEREVVLEAIALRLLHQLPRWEQDALEHVQRKLGVKSG